MEAYPVFTLLMSLIAYASAANSSQGGETDILLAIGEMQTANYFTFVTLINMVRDYIPGNTTFLMPNDRTLSKVLVPPNEVSEFLSRHSIPSPLRFDHLQHFPTGSIIPTHKPDYLLRISNGGRKSFYLNNVRLTSRNICVRGSSFRCHGINDVLTVTGDNTIATSSNCSSATARPSPAPLPSSGPEEDHLVSPTPVGLDDRPHKSDSHNQLNRGLFVTITAFVFLLLRS